MAECLCVGIGANKLNAFNVAINHVLHGIAAAAANPKNFNSGASVEFFGAYHFNGHHIAPLSFWVF